MTINMTRPKNDTKDLLLSITRNCETFIKQTHTRPQGTLEITLVNHNKLSYSNLLLILVSRWMIRLTSLEVYNSIFNINTTNNNFELYTDNFDEFSFKELEDELEEILSKSDITPYHLQHEKIGPHFTEAYRKLRLEKSSLDENVIILMGYA